MEHIQHIPSRLSCAVRALGWALALLAVSLGAHYGFPGHRVPAGEVMGAVVAFCLLLHIFDEDRTKRALTAEWATCVADTNHYIRNALQAMVGHRVLYHCAGERPCLDCPLKHIDEAVQRITWTLDEVLPPKAARCAEAESRAELLTPVATQARWAKRKS